MSVQNVTAPQHIPPAPPTGVLFLGTCKYGNPGISPIQPVTPATTISPATAQPSPPPAAGKRPFCERLSPWRGEASPPPALPCPALEGGGESFLPQTCRVAVPAPAAPRSLLQEVLEQLLALLGHLIAQLLVRGRRGLCRRQVHVCAQPSSAPTWRESAGTRQSAAPPPRPAPPTREFSRQILKGRHRLRMRGARRSIHSPALCSVPGGCMTSLPLALPSPFCPWASHAGTEKTPERTSHPVPTRVCPGAPAHLQEPPAEKPWGLNSNKC